MTSLVLVLLLSSTANSEECRWSTELGVNEASPCSGILVPPAKIRNALSCKRVDVPRISAERDKCLRDIDIRMKLYLAREDLLKSELSRERESSTFVDKILTVSIGLVSGILLGILL